MLQQLLENKGKFFIGFCVLSALVLIRTFEESLFYDPFIDYYKMDYLKKTLPFYNPVLLFLSLSFRFYLNSILSLALLYLIFKDTKILKFSVILYMILGSVLLILFFFYLKFFENDTMTLFYIRRFIIQPIFLMVFIPAFYYQKRVK